MVNLTASLKQKTMKKLPFLVVFTLAFFVSKSQLDNSSAKKVKPFKAYIKTVDNKTIKATLRGVNDSSLVLSRSRGEQWYIHAENIQSFLLKRKNGVGKGAMIGFNIGGNAPGLAGAVGGITGAVSGAIIGGITGALVKKKFIIDGSKETFCDLQSEILGKVERK